MVTRDDPSPIADVSPMPVAVTLQSPVTEVTSLVLEVSGLPVALMIAAPVATAVPVVDVVPTPVSVTLHVPVIVGVADVEVRLTPVASTGAYCPHVPLPQVSRPHPWTEAINYLLMRFLELQQLLQQQGT